jgi:GT2 family glycosyltransferase
MPRPWFDTKFVKFQDEQTGKEVFIPFGEDYSWCVSAREVGYKIFIDPLTKLTHHKKVAIRQ